MSEPPPLRILLKKPRERSVETQNKKAPGKSKTYTSRYEKAPKPIDMPPAGVTINTTTSSKAFGQNDHHLMRRARSISGTKALFPLNCRSKRKTIHPHIAEEGVVPPNEDFCWSCRGVGKFICCEACPRSFHFLCTDPPMDETDLFQVTSWFCKSCRFRKGSKRSVSNGYASSKHHPGVLNESTNKRNRGTGLSRAGALLARINPTKFSLPPSILSLFPNVGRDDSGSYVDLTEWRAPSAKTIRWNPEELYGIPMVVAGEPTPLCHGCGLSGLHGPIIQCDFCASCWHFDCLNPPMVSPPSTNKKWLCPLHVAHLRTRSRRETQPVQIYSNSTHLEHIDDMDEVQVVLTTKQPYRSSQLQIDQEVSAHAHKSKPRKIKLEPSDSRIIRIRLRVPEKCILDSFQNKIREEEAEERFKTMSVTRLWSPTVVPFDSLLEAIDTVHNK